MGRSRGGLTSKIHALVDAEGRPVTLFPRKRTAFTTGSFSRVTGRYGRGRSGWKLSEAR